MSDIATQIRARLDAIAAERSSLDDEERRLKKALAALDEAPAEWKPGDRIDAGLDLSTKEGWAEAARRSVEATRPSRRWERMMAEAQTIANSEPLRHNGPYPSPEEIWPIIRDALNQPMPTH